jgi:alpha-glucosidase (family GH31 glycosyl hydrolase)
MNDGHAHSLQMWLLLGGASMDAVVQQYTSLIGRPYMPPMWSLGFQLSRFGYKSTNDLKRVLIAKCASADTCVCLQVWQRQRHAHIPQDVQIVDIDYMSGRYVIHLCTHSLSCASFPLPAVPSQTHEFRPPIVDKIVD